MAGRVNQIDKAIAELEYQRSILEAAIKKLEALRFSVGKPAAKRTKKGKPSAQSGPDNGE